MSVSSGTVVVQPVIMNTATCLTPACNPASESTAAATQTTLSQYLISPPSVTTGVAAETISVSDSAPNLLQAITEEDVQRLLARSPTEFIVTTPNADKATAAISTEIDSGEQLVTVDDTAIGMSQTDVSASLQDAATIEWNGDTLLNLAGLRLQASTDLVLTPTNQITAAVSCDPLVVSGNGTCAAEQIGDSWPLQVVCPPGGDAKNVTLAQVVMQTSPLDYSQKLPGQQLVCCSAKDDSGTSQALFSELVASLGNTPKKEMETDISDAGSLSSTDTSQLLGFLDEGISLSEAQMRAALINDDDQSPMMSTKSVGVKHGDCCRCEILDFDSWFGTWLVKSFTRLLSSNE